MAGLNIENAVEDAVIATFNADGAFGTTPIIRWHDDNPDKVLPIILVHCHEVKSYQSSTVVVQGTIFVTIRTKTPDDKSQTVRDTLFQNALRIMRNTDSDVFDSHLAPGSAVAFNGFASVDSDEDFNDEKREQEMKITVDARFWMQ